MPSLTVEQALQTAVAFQKAGQFAAAASLCRQILSVQPDNAEALHFLGLIATSAGQHVEAAEWIVKAIARHPTQPVFHSNLGEIHRRLGQFEKAIVAFRRALELDGNSTEIHANLAAALIGAGQFDEAIASSRRALALRPHFAPGHNNLGSALANQGQWKEAVECFRRAVFFDPHYAEAQKNLRRALIETRQWTEVIAYLEPLARPSPGDAEVQNDLAVAYFETGQSNRAIDHYQRSLALRPDYAEAHNNLGNVLQRQDRWDEAIACYQRAVALRPDDGIAYTNLSVALKAKGQYSDALVCCQKAVACRPDFAGAHWNLAVLLLLVGRHEEGWREHEWRLQLPSHIFLRRSVVDPWDGGQASGQTILVRSEQGLGDTLQFVRYLSLVRRRAGATRVILECAQTLARLLRHVGDTAVEITTDANESAIDRQISLLSLPRTLGEFEPLRVDGAYLSADPELCAVWRERLDQNGNFRVGLVWSGSPTHTDDRHRSIHPEDLIPLLRVQGVSFYSLQVTSGSHSYECLIPGLIDPTGQITDFADTAALMAELDLIISVDTATAHLAGALGRPVWTLLPFVPDWRWGLEREDTPWYPTMRLFRQKTAGDWSEAIQRVAKELRTLSSQPRASRSPAFS